jgi:hypothetical protein
MYKIPENVMKQYLIVIDKYVNDVGKMVVKEILPQFDLASEQRLANQKIATVLEPFTGAEGSSQLESELNKIKV